MTQQQFHASLSQPGPGPGLSAPLAALWWDARGDWHKAHQLVDELETDEGMAVHAYLHRKQGSAANASYWYRRTALVARRETLEAEWAALLAALLRSA